MRILFNTTESCSSFQFFKLPLVFKLYLLKSLPVLELTLPMLLLQRNILLLSTVPVGSHDSNFTLLLLRPLTQFINQMLLLSLLCAQLFQLWLQIISSTGGPSHMMCIRRRLLKCL